MKKFVVLLLVLFTTMVLAHSASAIEVKRGLIKRLCINNAELGVNLIECEIEKIDQGRESIELMLSILVDIHKIDESTPKHEDIAKFKKTIQELYELREKKLEELRGAKQSLEKAKALPE